jgi:hypothetical protein
VLWNGDETDRDCGGPECSQCSLKKTCFVDNDCASGKCRAHQCVDVSCTNGTPNGDEQGIDCGGTLCGCCATTNQEYDAGVAQGFFGADVGPNDEARSVGLGVAFKLPTYLHAKSFGLHFSSMFQTGDDKPQAATLVLQIRDSSGKVLHTYESQVTDAFVGGWVEWDITQVMEANKTYYFTTYVKDGFTKLIHSGYNGDELAGSAIAEGYTAQIPNQPDDSQFASFTSWQTHSWDPWFRLGGCPTP